MRERARERHNKLWQVFEENFSGGGTKESAIAELQALADDAGKKKGSKAPDWQVGYSPASTHPRSKRKTGAIAGRASK